MDGHRGPLARWKSSLSSAGSLPCLLHTMLQSNQMTAASWRSSRLSSPLLFPMLYPLPEWPSHISLFKTLSQVQEPVQVLSTPPAYLPFPSLKLFKTPVQKLYCMFLGFSTKGCVCGMSPEDLKLWLLSFGPCSLDCLRQCFIPKRCTAHCCWIEACCVSADILACYFKYVFTTACLHLPRKDRRHLSHFEIN
jgi:hypothetical protein